MFVYDNTWQIHSMFTQTLPSVPRGPGSEKAWKFLQNSEEIYKLTLAVAILPSAEEVILSHFRWQTDEAYISAKISDTPLVIMADMKRSPAAKSICMLVRGLLQDEIDDNEYIQTCLNVFQHLHEGRFSILLPPQLFNLVKKKHHRRFGTYVK